MSFKLVRFLHLYLPF